MDDKVCYETGDVNAVKVSVRYGEDRFLATRSDIITGQIFLKEVTNVLLLRGV